MQIREYSLPNGWYPRDPDDAASAIEGYLGRGNPHDSDIKPSRAAVSPHAGWYYCGRLAAKAFSALSPDAGTIAIFGGHLPAGYPALFAMEDAVRTPFGPMPIDKELRSCLYSELGGIISKGSAEDRFRDNTIEVLLPMARFFFPKAQLLWLRLPSEIQSFEAGKALCEAAEKLNRKINVVASTDLTHYGSSYGFSPRGSGSKALRWAREENDAGFISAVESSDAVAVLDHAAQNQSACSAGAVLGAMGFTQAQGLGGLRLLEYATSADVQGDKEPDSFVGYAALVSSEE